MDTITLCRMACGDAVVKRKFAGVYASDNLPASRGKFCSFIINSDPQKLPGKHWMAVFFDEKEKKCYYFDSYGLPPLQHDIMRFLKNSAFEILYNETRYQQTGTSTCGLYCLYFLHRYSRRLYNLAGLTASNKSQNEIFVKSFVRRMVTLGACCHSFHNVVQSCKLLKVA